jgi:hypothetical protein
MDAKTQVLQALADYRAEHGITGDDLIQVSVPGEDAFTRWSEVSGMAGDPQTTVVALYVEGFGSFYPAVEDAIDDIDRYFMTE